MRIIHPCNKIFIYKLCFFSSSHFCAAVIPSQKLVQLEGLAKTHPQSMHARAGFPSAERSIMYIRRQQLSKYVWQELLEAAGLVLSALSTRRFLFAVVAHHVLR